MWQYPQRPLSANVNEPLPPKILVCRAREKGGKNKNGVKFIAGVEGVAGAAPRRFPGEYKAKVLREADSCKRPGKDRGHLPPEGLMILISPHVENTARPQSARGAGERHRPQGGEEKTQAGGVRGVGGGTSGG